MHKCFIALFIIVISALAIAAIFYAGPFYSYDDMNYVHFARQILTYGYSISESPYAYGFAYPYTIAAFYSLLGYGNLQSVLPNIIEYALIIIVGFFTAKKLFDCKNAVISAMLIAIAPFLIQYATRVMPDMLLGLLSGLSIMLLAYAQDSKHQKALYSMAGITAGFAVFIKLEALAFDLFFLLGALYLYKSGYYKREHKSKKSRNSRNSAFAGNVLYAVFFLIIAIYIYLLCIYASTGNAFYTFENYGAFQHKISPVNITDNIANLFVTLFAYVYSKSILSPFELNPIIYPYGFGIFFAILASIIGVILKNRKIATLSIISWGFFFYMYFGTMSLAKYIFIAVITRYFSMIVVPMSILSSFGILEVYSMVKHYSSKIAYAILALIIVEIIVFSIPTYITIYNYNKAIALNNNVIKCISNYTDSSKIYANTGIEALELETGFKNIFSQLGSGCNSTYANSTIVYIYTNSTEMQQGLKEWLGGMCNYVQIHLCAVNSNNIYNSTIISAELLRIHAR